MTETAPIKTPKRPLRFLLVRHGQSEANVQRTRDIPDESIQLTELGFQQATGCGKFLHDYLTNNTLPGGIALYCSSYMRARQTAQRIYDEIKNLDGYSHLRADESDFIVEQHHGFVDGYSDEEKAELYPDHKQREDLHWQHGSKQFAPIYGGELRMQVTARANNFLNSVFREHRDHNSNTIIIVSHGITMRQIAKLLLKLPREIADREPNPYNCDVRLLQRHGEANASFGDFGYIWHDSAAQTPMLATHERTKNLFERGAFRERIERV